MLFQAGGKTKKRMEKIRRFGLTIIGHYQESFKNLRDTNRYEVTDKVIDCNKMY